MRKELYAISEYHDTKEVYSKLDKLIGQPMRPIKREKMQEFLSYFENQCKRSKGLTDEAKKYIPGGVQHNLAFNYPFLCLEGCRPDRTIFNKKLSIPTIS